MDVTDSGSPYIFCSAGLAKLWMALSAQVVQKKKEKHSHTERRRRKAIGCSDGSAAAAPPAVWCAQAPWRSSSASRFQTMMTSTTSASRPPHTQAVRHEPVAAVMPAMNTGATAQPRLPEMPCTAKPWPRRCGETRLFRMVKSTG